MLIPAIIRITIYIYTYSVSESQSVGIVSVQVQCAGHEIIIGFLHTHKHKYICTYIYVNLPPKSPLKAIIRIVMDRDYMHMATSSIALPKTEPTRTHPLPPRMLSASCLPPRSPPPCRSKLAPCRSKLAHMCISMHPSRPLSS